MYDDIFRITPALSRSVSAENPSVEVPAGDFFCTGWQDAPRVVSIPVCVNPKNAFSSYWRMPFRSRCRVTIENRSDTAGPVYYQLDYELGEVRFHRDIRVTIQALGWRPGGRHLPLQDDIASTAFLYLSRPVESRPPLPCPDALEVI